MPKLKTDMFSRQLKALVKGAKAKKAAKVSKPLKGRVYHMASEDEREAMNNRNLDIACDIVKRFIEIHGNRYDYSHLKDIKKGDTITLYCKVHKSFEITTKAHYMKGGCPRCQVIKKSLLASFRKHHGNRYDYSLVNPYRYSDMIKIICPVHKVFEQRAHDHARGFPCRFCSYDQGGRGNKFTQAEFLEKAKAIHGDRYDYRLTFYRNTASKIIIKCRNPEHGVFMQTAGIHLSGSGCPDCAVLSRTNKTTRKLEDVIKHFKSIHGDKYDYSDVVYINNKIKIKIICPVHEVFEQRPQDHGRGYGCRFCKLEFKRAKRDGIQPKT